MIEIEDKLKSEITRLENELKEKDLKIANLEGYNKGTSDGFDMAKKLVLEKIRNLPEVKLNEISLNYFFSSLTQMIREIQTMDILNIRHGNNS